MVAMPRPMTAEELLSLDLPDKRTELIRGQLVVSEPPGIEHASIVGRVCYALSAFVRARPLDDGRLIGEVLAGDPGFWIERSPDTVRAPDVAFIAHGRLPRTLPKGFAEFAPNIVVEVLSPNDRPGKVLETVGAWLEAGSDLVWIVAPVERVARVYRSDGSEALLGAGSSLEGENVLPGFVLPLSDLFY